MSGISGVSGIGGMGALGANISVGAVCTGGLNGPVGNVNAATLSAMSGTRMGQLMELIEGFSSAEILIALMMAAASNHNKRHDSEDSGLGLLLGLAMASQIGQQLSAAMPTNCPAPAAHTGGTINLTA